MILISIGTALALIPWGVGAEKETYRETGAEGERPLHIEWRDGMLRIQSPRIPGGELEVWYLEAYCRKGSTDRDWAVTIIPFKSELVASEPAGAHIRLKDVLEPGVVVFHDIRAGTDEVAFDVTLTNPTEHAVDLEWAQPCLRVGTFTGLGQEDYIGRCFIFTQSGLTTLDKTRRTEVARYRGGQVYVPRGIEKADVNPRPISPDVPAYNLIGCTSADGTLLLAMAWDHVQELFQGVLTCIHADFRVGGLEPGETKRIRGRLYLLANDPEALLARYRRDFLSDAE